LKHVNGDIFLGEFRDGIAHGGSSALHTRSLSSFPNSSYQAQECIVTTTRPFLRARGPRAIVTAKERTEQGAVFCSLHTSGVEPFIHFCLLQNKRHLQRKNGQRASCISHAYQVSIHAPREVKERRRGVDVKGDNYSSAGIRLSRAHYNRHMHIGVCGSIGINGVGRDEY
jgi:hypothetical protein